MRPASRVRLLACCVAIPLAIAAAGCGSPNVIRSPRRAALFGSLVDSIVVEPFARGGRLAGWTTGINSADLKLFQVKLIAQIKARPYLRIYAEPPTELANTLIIAGRLTAFEVQDLPGKNLFLRAIHLGVEIELRPADRNEATHKIRRHMTYQKVYLPDETIPVAAFDLEKAAGEMAELIAEAIFPTGMEGDLPLGEARDPFTGEVQAHPALLSGNAHAVGHRYSSALEKWRLVLFDPSQSVEEDEEELFRISRRTLLELGKQGLEDQLLRSLEPMMDYDPMDLEDFREALRETLGGFNKLEPKILTTANHERDRMHLNLAAAHGNLATLYWYLSHYDLAVYHLARAWVNYPQEWHVAKWSKIQKARGLFPEELKPREALALYLTLPPPRMAYMKPGPAENSLFVPAVFEPPRGQPAAEAQGAAPEGAQQEGPALKPVELPPAPEPASAEKRQ